MNYPVYRKNKISTHTFLKHDISGLKDFDKSIIHNYPYNAVNVTNRAAKILEIWIERNAMMVVF